VRLEAVLPFCGKKNENNVNSCILEFALNTKLRREFGNPEEIRKPKPGGKAHINPSQLSRTTPLQPVIYYLHGCPAFQGFVTVREIRIGCLGLSEVFQL